MSAWQGRARHTRSGTRRPRPCSLRASRARRVVQDVMPRPCEAGRGTRPSSAPRCSAPRRSAPRCCDLSLGGCAAGHDCQGSHAGPADVPRHCPPAQGAAGGDPPQPGHPLPALVRPSKLPACAGERMTCRGAHRSSRFQILDLGAWSRLPAQEPPLAASYSLAIPSLCWCVPPSIQRALGSRRPVLHCSSRLRTSTAGRPCLRRRLVATCHSPASPSLGAWLCSWVSCCRLGGGRGAQQVRGARERCCAGRSASAFCEWTC